MKSAALRKYTIPDIVDGEAGGLLDRQALHTLWQTVPPLCQCAEWSLVYGLTQHGAVASTLLRRAANIEQTLLVVKTTTWRTAGMSTRRLLRRAWRSGVSTAVRH